MQGHHVSNTPGVGDECHVARLPQGTLNPVVFRFFIVSSNSSFFFPRGQVLSNSCLIVCTICSAAVFPLLGRGQLGVFDSTGRLVDETGQEVDWCAVWRKFPHCHQQCAGAKGTQKDCLATLNVNIILPELVDVNYFLQNAKPGQGKCFHFPKGVLSNMHCPIACTFKTL
jgi:hypothetical protein